MHNSLDGKIQRFNGISKSLKALSSSGKGPDLQYIKSQAGEKNSALLSFLIKFVGAGGYVYDYATVIVLINLLTRGDTHTAVDALRKSVQCVKKIKSNGNYVQETRLKSLSAIICCLATKAEVFKPQTFIKSTFQALAFLFKDTSSFENLIASLFIAHSEALLLQNSCTALYIALMSNAVYKKAIETDNTVFPDNLEVLNYFYQASKADLEEKMRPLEAKLSCFLKIFGRQTFESQFSGSALDYIIKNENIGTIALSIVNRAVISDKYESFREINLDILRSVIAFLFHHAGSKSCDDHKYCIIYAAKTASPKTIQMLLSAGYQSVIDHQDNLSKTALMYATEKCCFEITEILVNAGANPFIEDKHGNTPMQHARANNLEKKFIDLLQKAETKTRKVEMHRELLNVIQQDGLTR